MTPPADVTRLLSQFGQEHLLQFWPELSPSHRERLLQQIAAIDFPLVHRLICERARYKEEALAIRAKAERAQPPQQLLRQPGTQADTQHWAEARKVGEALLQEGKVAAVVVAGGQGSRLGFEKPKGMFPIGPVSQRTLFQVFCEQLRAQSPRPDRPIPYLVMTSEATHADTVAFFAEHKHFGLPLEDIFFFQQGALPAVDELTGKILLSAPGEICLSPDGHGGILKALAKSGLLNELRIRGIEVLYYHQVDNPTATLCDPVFLGLHRLAGSQMSTKVAAKESAAEKMGVLVSVDGQTQIIEYSDLPTDRAEALAPDGSLLLWAGNTAIHAFERQFLEGVVANGGELPYHFANKSVPCIDEAGQPVALAADYKNGVKFEQFIFDVLPLAQTALVVECDRASEFNPVKNATGKDSPEVSRAAMHWLAAQWLRSHGAEVADGARLEINPCWAARISKTGPQPLQGQRFEGEHTLDDSWCPK